MPESLFKKETLAQVLFCKFCEIFKNTIFHRTPLVAAFAFKTTEGKTQRVGYITS